jgi:hypothetical protein
MLEIIIDISLCILIAAGFALSIGVIRKDSKYIGNRLFALSTASIGCYGIFILIYQLLPFDEVIINLERWAYIFALLCTFFLFLSMQVIAHSRDWLNNIVHTVPFVVIIALYIIALFSWPGIITIQSYVPVNTVLDTIFSIIIGVLIFYFLFSSVFAIYKYGLHNTDPGRRKRMLAAITGLSIIIVAVVLNTLSDLVGDVVLGSIFDAIYFLTLCTGVVFVAIGFIGRAKES